MMYVKVFEANKLADGLIKRTPSTLDEIAGGILGPFGQQYDGIRHI